MVSWEKLMENRAPIQGMIVDHDTMGIPTSDVMGHSKSLVSLDWTVAQALTDIHIIYYHIDKSI